MCVRVNKRIPKSLQFWHLNCLIKSIYGYLGRYLFSYTPVFFCMKYNCMLPVCNGILPQKFPIQGQLLFY